MLTRRDGSAEPVGQEDQIIMREMETEKYSFSLRSDNREQDWQPYPVNPYSAIYDDHTHIIHTH